MLKRLSQRELLEQIAADWQPQIRAAWLEAINAITSRVVLRRIVERLERGDVSGVINDLGITDGTFAKFENALIQAYHGGGIATVGSMPAVRDPSGGRIVFSWGVRNLSAEQAMRDHAARLVTGIVTEARDGIAAVLTDNLSRGQSPYDAGRLIAGRLNRSSGQREGGLIGLSRPQMETVARIERAMRDGDTAYMREYLSFKNRDKRLDRMVIKAIREGRGLAPEEVERVTRLYSNKALKRRGEIISRHETMMALDRSRDDAFRQQIIDGKLDASDITKVWKHTPREHSRLQHIAMNGQSVQFDQPFIAPDGTQLRYPRDPNAPVSHTLNCFCRAEYLIDHSGVLARRYRTTRRG